MHWFVEPCEGVHEEIYAPCKLSCLGVGEGVEPSIGEVQGSPPGGGGRDGES